MSDLTGEREKEIREWVDAEVGMVSGHIKPIVREILAALDECRRERGIVFTKDELMALASALEGIEGTPIVPDIAVFYTAEQKIVDAHDKANE